MSNHIAPPVLLSRVMMFVFASSLVMLGALAFTVYDMFPLNRPQIFFLTTQPRENMEITLTEMVPNDDNFKMYKQRFVREYIRARNEIFPNTRVMQRKWANDENGIVRTWSTPEVYSDFAKTDMWTALMNDVPDFEFRCQVEFLSDGTDVGARSRDGDTYAVKFRYFCSNNNGQTDPKDYTIVMKLSFGAPNEIRWTDRMNNPLGIRVSEYRIESGNGDPLTTGFLSE